MDSPAPADPLPHVWAGTTSDRSDAYQLGPAIKAMDLHRFTPPTINVFVVDQQRRRRPALPGLPPALAHPRG